MKYFFRIIFVFILAVTVVFAAYYFSHGQKLPGNFSNSELTTMSKAPATEKYASRTLIASLDKYNFKLYKSGNTVILEHGDKEFEFENWSSVITAEEPKLFYGEYDGDSDKELIVRAVSGEDEVTGEYVYDIYVLNPVDSEESDYSVLLVSQDIWRTVLAEQVSAELSQLKSCDKIVQFAMDTKKAGISYNQDTGLAEEAASLGFGKALRGSDGKFLKLSSWSKGKGIFSINDDGNIDVTVEVLAEYEGITTSQDLGNIHFTLNITPENTLEVAKHSMYFAPNDEYTVSDPRGTAKKDWSFMRNNSYTPKGSGKIQWAKYALKIDPSVMTDTDDLGGEDTDIKNVRLIKITQEGVWLTAASGYTFDNSSINKGDFSLVINKGSDNEYEISYEAKLNEEKTTLKLSFDRRYAQKDIKTIDISYGAK